MITVEPDIITWRKSSFSDGADACVEVGWRKSSYSANGADCIEVAVTPPGVAVRDSKYPTGPVLTFSQARWRGFLIALG